MIQLSKLKTKAKSKTADNPDPEDTFLWMCTLSESLMLLLQQQWHDINKVVSYTFILIGENIHDFASCIE